MIILFLSTGAPITDKPVPLRATYLDHPSTYDQTLKLLPFEAGRLLRGLHFRRRHLRALNCAVYAAHDEVLHHREATTLTNGAGGGPRRSSEDRTL